MQERWLPIPEYEGSYEVSDLGRIRSLRGYKRKEKIRKLVLRDDGYLQVTLYKNCIGKLWLVHRAVLFSFTGDPPEGMEGAHLDGNKANNALANLTWATSLDNNRHKVAHGTNGSGEKNAMAKITPEIVIEIRTSYNRHSPSRTCKALAEKYGISFQHVWDIVQRRRWSHI